jgi:hypothetical protein
VLGALVAEARGARRRFEGRRAHFDAVMDRAAGCLRYAHNVIVVAAALVIVQRGHRRPATSSPSPSARTKMVEIAEDS